MFSHPPNQHNTLSAGVFGPEEREFVLDIDLTDYDSVRTCCTGANICKRCWRYMAMAVKVTDVGLREDFGFQHIAWFYSGRRGIHCWVSDESARTLSDQGRSAVATYFSLDLDSGDFKLKGNLHPLHRRAYAQLEPQFVSAILRKEGMGLLAGQEAWVKLLKTLPVAAIEAGVAADLDAAWCKKNCALTEEEKWFAITERLRELRKKNAGGKSQKMLSGEQTREIEAWQYETVFKHTYPRLDINVSKMRNHLLKSPFCIHPKTGRVCVPLDPATIDEFDPFQVPTLPQIVREMEEYDKANAGTDAANVPHWQKTSLKPTFSFFLKNFLNSLKSNNRRRKMDAQEKEAATSAEPF